MSGEFMTLPAVALRGTTILPGMVVHFDVSRERSRKAVEEAMMTDQRVFLVSQIRVEQEDPGYADVFHTGTIAMIRQVIRISGENLRVLAEGRQRGHLEGFEQDSPFLAARILPVREEKSFDSPQLDEAVYRNLIYLFERYLSAGGKIGKELAAKIMKADSAAALIKEISIHIPLNRERRQSFLEARSLTAQYETLARILGDEISVLEIQRELQSKVKARVEQTQREFILREQMKVIREELGEDAAGADADHFREKLRGLEISDSVREKISREIDRFDRMNPSFPDSNVQRTYLETVFELPWNRCGEENTNMKSAWHILDEGHYGLKDVKERIMEYLAVRMISEEVRSPILCLVGPPGTGKTSIARSVAEALGRKYVRVCLGGVRDESQIRGHRRTYVGALPGDITSALRQAGTANPLMLLDEVDKTGSDYRGDVSSALLEVLDPEQNCHFLDHYLDIPQDLSRVLFLATANDAGKIPRPLLDRMEILEIPGYTENEKMHIARKHLIPKQLEENGIPRQMLKITDGALKKIINHYTREAGVRHLERNIGKLCRKTARIYLEENRMEVRVTGRNLEEFLGKPKYHFLMANKKDEIGVARGLAWTQAGGDTLEIEVNVLPGKGEIIMTGQLGDVMKESAQAGITYIRSIAEDYHVDQEFFQDHDLHVHIPEGAVPKDGPSAGITMATAMLSAIAGRPVRADLAMTGEITLRGRVLPIGGLKEKLLAARYAGMKQVLVPDENTPDIREMDEEILDGLTVTPVSTMDQVLLAALV